PYVDRFPYGSETLEKKSLVPNRVTVVEPVANSVLAAQTRKTIRWVAQGCAYVNLYYGFVGGPQPPPLIAGRYPNTGYYVWSVPPVPVRNDYYVQVNCTDSNGLVLAYDVGPRFTIASPDLVLLNPGRGTRAANNSTVRVAWKAGPLVTAVNVFVKTGLGGEALVASNITGTSF